jgi:hypothetical protein
MDMLLYLLVLLAYAIAGIAMVVLAGFLLYYAGRLVGLGFMRSFVEAIGSDRRQ